MLSHPVFVSGIYTTRSWDICFGFSSTIGKKLHRYPTAHETSDFPIHFLHNLVRTLSVDGIAGPEPALRIACRAGPDLYHQYEMGPWCIHLVSQEQQGILSATKEPQGQFLSELNSRKGFRTLDLGYSSSGFCLMLNILAVFTRDFLRRKVSEKFGRFWENREGTFSRYVKYSW